MLYQPVDCRTGDSRYMKKIPPPFEGRLKVARVATIFAIPPSAAQETYSRRYVTSRVCLDKQHARWSLALYGVQRKGRGYH